MPLIALVSGAYARLVDVVAGSSQRRNTDDVRETHEPIEITGKRGNAALVGEDDWRVSWRLVYQVLMDEPVVKVLRMCSHNE